MSEVNWNTIRSEYIGGNISQRKLAKKYGMTYAAIRNKADSENWVALRDEALRTGNALAVMRVAEAAAENAVVAQQIRAKMLQYIDSQLDKMISAEGSEITQSITEKDGEKTKKITKALRLRDFAASYKDIVGASDGAENTAGQTNE